MIEIGFAENYGIYVGHMNQKTFLDGVYNYSEYQKNKSMKYTTIEYLGFLQLLRLAN